MKRAELEAERQRLLALANEMAREHWGVDYTGGFVLHNYAWRSWNACFTWYEDGTCAIRMSAPTNARHTEKQIRGYLLHELVHWRLWSQKLPNGDRDEAFVAECLRVGAPLSEARYAQKAYENYKRKVDAA